jgi:hypothetical protein
MKRCANPGHHQGVGESGKAHLRGMLANNGMVVPRPRERRFSMCVVLRGGVDFDRMVRSGRHTPRSWAASRNSIRSNSTYF